MQRRKNNKQDGSYYRPRSNRIVLNWHLLRNCIVLNWHLLKRMLPLPHHHTALQVPFSYLLW